MNAFCQKEGLATSEVSGSLYVPINLTFLSPKILNVAQFVGGGGEDTIPFALSI
jgi:hypothetical protein